jgi:hypothetical protein
MGPSPQQVILTGMMADKARVLQELQNVGTAKDRLDIS